MREIVLDTETTGFEPKEGHRLVEIGCVEIMHQLPTGKTFHQYINPERDMPAEAQRVHGLSEDFLSEYPIFTDIADSFLEFIADDPLIIHNAKFDIKFLNAELTRLKKDIIPIEQTVDTLSMARKFFPGAPATLDALCRKFEIDNSNRTLHGALLDAELLAEVYLELLGGRQRGLSFLVENNNLQNNNKKNISIIKSKKTKPKREPRIFKISKIEKESHIHMIKELNDSIWNN